MELKKHKLLLMLQQDVNPGSLHFQPPNSDNAPNLDALASEVPHTTGPSLAEEEDELVGMKCRAPLKEASATLICSCYQGVQLSIMMVLFTAVMGWRESSQCHYSVSRTPQTSSRSEGP